MIKKYQGSDHVVLATEGTIHMHAHPFTDVNASKQTFIKFA